MLTRRSLKAVSRTGRITLGEQYSGRQFELEELVSGVLVLHPVSQLPESAVSAPSAVAKKPGFHIAVVEQVAMPPREQRNARSEWN